MCEFACGHKNLHTGGYAAHYEKVCDVLAGVDENPSKLKVCNNYNVQD